MVSKTKTALEKKQNASHLRGLNQWNPRTGGGNLQWLLRHFPKKKKKSVIPWVACELRNQKQIQTPTPQFQKFLRLLVHLINREGRAGQMLEKVVTWGGDPFGDFPHLADMFCALWDPPPPGKAGSPPPHSASPHSPVAKLIFGDPVGFTPAGSFRKVAKPERNFVAQGEYKL